MKFFYRRQYSFIHKGQMTHVAKVYLKIGTFLIPTPFNRITTNDNF